MDYRPLPGDDQSFEQDAARISRDFHDQQVRDAAPEERREGLAQFARAVYQERLHIPVEGTVRETLRQLQDPNVLMLEMAHDGQLPHLGIVRLVLKTHDIAVADGRAVALYLVGNHYTAAMRPDNIRFGMPLRGQPPDSVKHPPKVRIGKSHADTPFRWLPPPTSEDLNALETQVADFVSNNLAHERKSGTRVHAYAGDIIRERLDSVFGVLSGAARDVASFGDWLVRVQHDLFLRLLGGEADRILFLPMADLAVLFRAELEMIAREAGSVSKIKSDVSAEQRSRGDEPYQRRSEPSSFWVYCPSCYRRRRELWSPGALEFVCATCGHREKLRGDDLWRWVMPDIVAYEAGVFRLGIAGWVVGSRAAYHPVIERVYTHVFRAPMPPRFYGTSIPVFRGVGDPAEGDSKTRLLRALLEIDPPALARALRAPWRENPNILSDVFAGQT